MTKNTVPNTPFMYYSNRLECELIERELRSQAQWAAACAIGRFFKNSYKQARAVMSDAAQLQRELSSNPVRTN
jgi:hypothetical protein